MVLFELWMDLRICHNITACNAKFSKITPIGIPESLIGVSKKWEEYALGGFIAESFYNVKYGSSVIMSKNPSKILSNENMKTGVSRTIVFFGILIHVLPWGHQKHQCFCFHYWDLLTNFWCNNWRSIFDVVERLC